MTKNTEPKKRQNRTVPRRTFFRTAATAIAGLFGIRAVDAAASPPEEAEREADYYRPLFRRGKDLAG